MNSIIIYLPLSVIRQFSTDRCAALPPFVHSVSHRGRSGLWLTLTAAAAAAQPAACLSLHNSVDSAAPLRFLSGLHVVQLTQFGSEQGPCPPPTLQHPIQTPDYRFWSEMNNLVCVIFVICLMKRWGWPSCLQVIHCPHVHRTSSVFHRPLSESSYSAGFPPNLPMMLCSVISPTFSNFFVPFINSFYIYITITFIYNLFIFLFWLASYFLVLYFCKSVRLEGFMHFNVKSNDTYYP